MGLRVGQGAERRGPTTIRGRLVPTILLLVAFALVAGGLTAYAVERARLVNRVQLDLERESRDFVTFARTSLDPATGEPFRSLDPLLRAAMARRSLGATEGIVGLIDGEIAWVAPAGARVRPETMPGLIATVTPLATRTTTVTGRYQAEGVDLGYAVMPVAAGKSHGALVQVVDIRAELDALGTTFRTYAWTGLGTLFLAGAVVALVTTRLLRPIARVRETAEAIGESDLTTRIPLEGRDELSALARTINAMLDRIETLVGRERRLYDDVGHELRTPLTIAGGHLELLDPDDPDDVAETTRIVAAQLRRMGRLVEDLLLLAHSDREDFVTPTCTHLGSLLDDALTQARVLGDRHWLLESTSEEEVLLDPDRITQALHQLVSNAVTYSDSGATVALGARVDGDEVRLWVRDDGIGIPEKDQERILERFARGSNTARRAGHGLGLAIVDSIARGHDGRLDLTSAPGEGTTVTLVIPRRPCPKEMT